jgi:hypothetical protein
MSCFNPSALTAQWQHYAAIPVVSPRGKTEKEEKTLRGQVADSEMRDQTDDDH